MTRSFQHADYSGEGSAPGFGNEMPVSVGAVANSRHRAARGHGKMEGRILAGIIGPSITNRNNIVRASPTIIRDGAGNVTVSNIGTLPQFVSLGSRIRICVDPGPLSTIKDVYNIEGEFYITSKTAATISYVDQRLPIYTATSQPGTPNVPNIEINFLNMCSMSSWATTYLSMYSDGAIRTIRSICMGGTNSRYIVSHVQDLIEDPRIDMIIMSGGAFGQGIVGLANDTDMTEIALLKQCVGRILNAGKLCCVGTPPPNETVAGNPQYSYLSNLYWYMMKKLQLEYPGVIILEEQRALILPADTNGFVDNDYVLDGNIHWNSEGAKRQAWDLFTRTSHLISRGQRTLGFSVKDNVYNAPGVSSTNIARGWYNVATQAITAGVGGFSGVIPVGASFTATGGGGISSVVAVANTIKAEADEWQLQCAVGNASVHTIAITGVANEMAGQLAPGFWEGSIPVYLDVGRNTLQSVTIWAEITYVSDGTSRICSAPFHNLGVGQDSTNLQSGFGGLIQFPTWLIPTGAVISAFQITITLNANAAGNYNLTIGGNFRIEQERIPQI